MTTRSPSAFDETKAALLARSAGLGLRIVEGTGAGQIMIRQIDPVEISPGEFAHVVRASVEEHTGASGGD